MTGRWRRHRRPAVACDRSTTSASTGGRPTMGLAENEGSTIPTNCARPKQQARQRSRTKGTGPAMTMIAAASALAFLGVVALLGPPSTFTTRHTEITPSTGQPLRRGVADVVGRSVLATGAGDGGRGEENESSSTVGGLTATMAAPAFVNTTPSMSYLPWELASVTSLVGDPTRVNARRDRGTCTPPPPPDPAEQGGRGIVGAVNHESCCLGTMFRRVATTYDKTRQCAIGHTGAYEVVREAAVEALHRWPLRLRTGQLGSAPSHNDVAADMTLPSMSCDACRMVDIALDRGWTFTFLGDSMQHQTWDGFLCALVRSGRYLYRVVSREGRKGRFEDEVRRQGWQNGIFSIITVEIYPTPEEDGAGAGIDVRDDRSEGSPARCFVTARLYKFAKYRPGSGEDAADFEEVVKSVSDDRSNVLLFNFGVHWLVGDAGNYTGAMVEVLSTLRRNRRNFALLAWRETAAQHHRRPGGEFSSSWLTEKRGDWGCAASGDVGDPLYGWRERIVRGAATELGFRMRNSDETLPFPTGTLSSFSSNEQRHDGLSGGPRRVDNVVGVNKDLVRGEDIDDELLVVPFLNYTVGLGILHKVGVNETDCTHYCNSPFLWAPLWRSMRLGMEYRAARLPRLSSQP